jgi:hypothetical protein
MRWRKRSEGMRRVASDRRGLDAASTRSVRSIATDADLVQLLNALRHAIPVLGYRHGTRFFETNWTLGSIARRALKALKTFRRSPDRCRNKKGTFCLHDYAVPGILIYSGIG